MSDETNVRKSISAGFTMQIDAYEPVKVQFFTERGLHPAEEECDLAENIAREVAIELKKIAVELVKGIIIIKDEIRSELEDDD